MSWQRKEPHGSKFRRICGRWRKKASSIDIFISAAQHAVSTAENQAASVQAGAKEVGELAMGFAERNVTSSFEFAQRLLQAKDPMDVMALHADYVSSQIAALTEQGKEVGERLAKMTGQGSKL